MVAEEHQEGDVRLAGEHAVTTSSGGARGLLQIYGAGVWASVHRDDLTGEAARLACQQLGWDTGGAVYDAVSLYGPGPADPLWRMGFECGPADAKLSLCPRRYTYGEYRWQADGSGSQDLAGVDCYKGELLICVCNWGSVRRTRACANVA